MSGTVTTSTLFTVANGTLAGGGALGSESMAHDASRGLLFVLGPNGVDALNAATGALVFSIPKTMIFQPGTPGTVQALGNGNSVAVNGNTLAVAFDGAVAGSPGFAAAFTLSGTGAATTAAWRATAQVGVTPDMVTFTPDGTRLLVAIEAEPTAGYAADAPGGLAIVDVASWTSSFYGFGAFDAQAAALRSAGIKLSNAIPGSTGANQALPSLDLEPEYITVSGNRAYVTLQENNGVAVFDLATNAWVNIIALGTSNHSVVGNGIDTSDRDGGAVIRQVPIQGMYQPDAIASFVQNGITYLVTANEGDAREYGGVFNEGVRISALVPATGSTPPAGMPALDPALLAQIQPRRGDADLGRYDVSRWAGDTDGDGDIDQLMGFGSRSFTIWEVGGTTGAPTLTQRFNSGQIIDQVIASQFPSLYDDNRSDNKGAEPEQVTLGTVDGQLYAFVGLERANANMVFKIDGPTAVSYAGLLRQTGDIASEVTAFIPAADGNPARLAVANEVSATTTVFNVAPASGNYRLQILHGSDFEAGLLATGRADRFAAIVDKLEDALPNSITLSAGDNFLPGPFAAAGTDNSMVPVLRAYYEQALGLPAGSLTGLFGTNLATATSPFFATDIAILNAIGIQVSVLGNHDFDLGPNPLAAAFDFVAAATATTQLGRITNIGAQFPYISANLDFTLDGSLNPLFTTTLREASTYATTNADLVNADAGVQTQNITNENVDRQLAPWTTIQEGGQTIGILGLTTQVLASISTLGSVRVLDPAGDGGVDNMSELATIIQPWINQMLAQGINKIVLLSHLQNFSNELALAPLISGVDIIISAGSHAIFADSNDVLRPGDIAREGYPVLRVAADGKPVLITSTDSEFSYVGRLVVEFDAAGVLIADPDGTGPLGVGAADPLINGPIAATDANVAALWGSDNPYLDGSRGGEVRQLTDQITTVIAAKDGNVFGRTNVFLEGRRTEVRAEETNLGNLTADANLFVARQVDPGVLVSFKNGGGIRAEIGTVLGQPIPTELPPQANPTSGKPVGGVSQLDIENSLRFNNALSIVGVTAANLERIFEHAVAAWTATATPGQFGQIGGASFSFDPTRTAQVVNSTTGVVTTEGLRVQNLVLLNQDGSIADTIVSGGIFQGDANRVIKVVTLDFLASGGDSYPFAPYTIAGSRVNLLDNAGLGAGVATFATKGSEQDALAEFFAATHNTAATAYSVLDGTPANDLRIQNLSVRSDTVALPYAEVTPMGGATVLSQMTVLTGAQQFQANGTSGAETIRGKVAAEAIFGLAGNDVLNGGAGNDLLDGGQGRDVAQFNVNRADATVTRNADGSVTVVSTDGTDTLRSIEVVRFNDGDAVVAPKAKDFSADGLGDILWHRTDGLVYGWTMNGPAITSQAGFAGVSPAQWSVRFAGDMTGDGKADLLWQNLAGDLNLWTMNGLGVTSTANLAAPSGWTLVGQGDLDGDRKADLVWQNAAGTVYNWQMDGTAITAQGGLAQLAANRVLSVADFNGDAQADILFRAADGAMQLWTMEGISLLASASVTTRTTDWALRGTGDLNADGKADLVWQNTGTGAVQTWLMDGANVASVGNQGAVGSEWSVASVADYTGDDRADVLWRNTDGSVYLWQMNGNAIAQQGTIAFVGNEWSIIA